MIIKQQSLSEEAWNFSVLFSASNNTLPSTLESAHTNATILKFTSLILTMGFKLNIPSINEAFGPNNFYLSLTSSSVNNGLRLSYLSTMFAPFIIDDREPSND